MADRQAIVIAGEAVDLLGDRALYWPARQRLLIADLHLGKGDVFRHAGIALPSGGTADDLDRLSALIARTGATSLWVLGDLLHGHLVDTAWREPWERFRATHAGLAIALVSGNHDRAVRRAGLDIEHLPDAVSDGPFVLSHAPPTDPQRAGAVRAGFGLCGHLHPVVRVPGFRGRFPAFVVHGDHLVLPAFSLFTGGWLETRRSQRYACLGGEVLALGIRADAAVCRPHRL